MESALRKVLQRVLAIVGARRRNFSALDSWILLLLKVIQTKEAAMEDKVQHTNHNSSSSGNIKDRVDHEQEEVRHPKLRLERQQLRLANDLCQAV